MRRRTIEWQVCGVCNYDCSYCIQSKASRVGQPTDEEVESFLRFFAALDAAWEVKMTGGEPFASKAFMARIIPGLVAETKHTVSVVVSAS
jgi:molybdenum cofactor biosynthesis enzyme MoaA